MLCASTYVPEHREILFLLTKPLLPKMQKPLTSVKSRFQPHPAASLVLTKTKHPRERERERERESNFSPTPSSKKKTKEHSDATPPRPTRLESFPYCTSTKE
jgi:hypothetical protein